MIQHLLYLILLLVYSSTSCSIFPSLNCSCFQSNIDLNSSLPRKTYSHLYCQGKNLNEKTFQTPFGSDFKYQNHFRTISIEFFIENRIEIQSYQFDPLAMLFSDTPIDANIDIIIRLNGFHHITFHKHSLTSTIFQQKHQHKRLWIHLIPVRSNLTEIEFDEENSTKVEDQFNFSLNCFSGLIVSKLTLSIHTIRDYFPSKYTFEQIFNNTNIGELHFHGAIIRPALSSLKQTFKGLVRSLTLHRHVDIIDANTFPFYSHVYSYTIHSIEAHSMNLSSFLSSYRNLRGLEIIKPRFYVSIDKLIPTLDSLTLDVEDLNEETLLAARHIHNLKLGSRLHTIEPEIFQLLSPRLRHFDLSDVDLSHMTSDSRCHLIKYLSKNSNQQLNIIYPQIGNLTECDCARLYINDIQLTSKSSINYDLTCLKICHFSDCQIISEYFHEKYPLIVDDNQTITETIYKNNTNELQSVDIFSDDPVDVDLINYLINQTSDQERNHTQRRPIITPFIDIDMENISTLENIQEYDDMSFSTPSLFNDKKDLFSWLSFFIGVGVILLILLIISLIILLIIQYRKKHNFKPLPVYV